MSDFDWKKNKDVGIHLKNHSSKEEYQRSSISRFYYACFGPSKEYLRAQRNRVDYNKKSQHFSVVKSKRIVEDIFSILEGLKKHLVRIIKK